ncbi:hypothetical protein E2C01_093505 [Portunus trituberculatus]|uniref:Uncharacterized protein n=1 Tax=Portunus trituberculatus TaxID=210409 RepID=A0A5B7JPZ3_PORTR|nr:hypothetical protein [Portunus trituberculatus]
MLLHNLNTPASLILPPLPPSTPPPVSAPSSGLTRWSALVLAPSKGFLRPSTPRCASGYQEP